MRALSCSRSAASSRTWAARRRVSASVSLGARRNLANRLHGLADIGERKLQALAAGFGLAGRGHGGERDGRRAAPAAQPPEPARVRRCWRMFGKSGSGGELLIAMDGL